MKTRKARQTRTPPEGRGIRYIGGHPSALAFGVRFRRGAWRSAGTLDQDALDLLTRNPQFEVSAPPPRSAKAVAPSEGSDDGNMS